MKNKNQYNSTDPKQVNGRIHRLVSSGITRALIIRNPHISNIMDGTKIWEMRGSTSKPKGKIGLIEAGSGLIVGICEHLGSGHPIDSEETAIATKPFHQVEDISKLKKWKYPWFMKDAYRLDQPIPYDHPQGAVIWVNLES